MYISCITDHDLANDTLYHNNAHFPLYEYVKYIWGQHTKASPQDCWPESLTKLALPTLEHRDTYSAYVVWRKLYGDKSRSPLWCVSFHKFDLVWLLFMSCGINNLPQHR
jgi:hypothetical protein